MDPALGAAPASAEKPRPTLASGHERQPAADADQVRNMAYVYVGSGGWGGKTDGKVSVYELGASGELILIERVDAGGLASFIGFHPSGKFLYACDEALGTLNAFGIDTKSGKLTPLNVAKTLGHPVYVTISKNGRFALLAYYNEGKVEVMSLAADGRIEKSVDQRVTGEQAHSIVLDRENRFAFVPNKGKNSISELRFEPNQGRVAPGNKAEIPASGGPRHLDFHPSRPFAYVMNEVVPGITAYAFDDKLGTLSPLQTLSAAFAGTSEKASGADVHVAPSGRFVYGSVRDGDKSAIVIYAIDETSGKLSSIGHESTRGRTPRNFALHPDGSLLLAANQDSNSIAVFKVKSDGKLELLKLTDVGVAPFYVSIRPR